MDDQKTKHTADSKPLWANTITIAGFGLAITTLLLCLTFGLFTIVTPTTNPYVDIVGYLILPSMLIFGVGAMPFGILFKSWRLRRRNPDQKLAFRFPRIDLNDSGQRRVAKYVAIGTFIMIPVVALSSYNGYHFTDSTEFCAKACHEVMQPQGTTYEHSAHARVACAECHIGSGASWFVKAKLSGTRQVYAVLANSFSRPIPPAIKHLRPARETCEQCHWPKKFFGAQLRELVRFSSDEDNTRRNVSMLLKTGGGDESTGRAEGIHLHMALAGRIEYIATDQQLQRIPWVKLTDELGKELIYRSDGKASSDPPPDGQVRQLDCMDCHNRPAHKFRAPQDAVDLYLSSGRIDTTLPFIKREAVSALLQPYPDTETAVVLISRSINEFYNNNYPQLSETRKASTTQAIGATQDIYRHTFFPTMKVDWKTYPDNIGHKISAGCFRCHDGSHINQEGNRISHACNTCHTFLNPINNHPGKSAVVEGEFIHPYELTGVHATMRCDRCHTGGKAPVATCEGCHEDQNAFRHGTLAAFAPFGVEADVMADAVDCESCHDLTEPTSIETIGSLCMDCHDDDEERFDGMLAGWNTEVEELLRQAESRTDAAGLRAIERLRKAGPLHNIEATRTIVRSLSIEAKEDQQQ